MYIIKRCSNIHSELDIYEYVRRCLLPLFNTQNVRTYLLHIILKEVQRHISEYFCAWCFNFQVLNSATCVQIPATLTTWWPYNILAIQIPRFQKGFLLFTESGPPNSNASQQKWMLNTSSIMWKQKWEGEANISKGKKKI